MIPFSPPRMDQAIFDEVIDTLKSGWITTGPKTKLFEKKIAAYCGCSHVLCLNSATAGLEIMLRWFGVGIGDEVIVPAYTYSATANVVKHCGATPVLADVRADDFNMDVSLLETLITARTKVIMPVDFGGMPCDYTAINTLVRKEAVRNKFCANSENQKMLGRILVLSDAAHSFGASVNESKTGVLTDVSVFSFHAVKNLSTAEGGAVALNLPAPFNNEEVYKFLCIYTLHGQNKDALAKVQKGNWKYDILMPGYKCNMTDIMAAIGLVELARYDYDMLKKREYICEKYASLLSHKTWAQVPVFTADADEQKTKSSYHLFPLRIKGINEEQRDRIIAEIFNCDVSVNVHFIPLPMLSFYKEAGYKIDGYPVTYDNYAREISLPVFYDLSDDQINTVISAVSSSVEKILHQENISV